ncbi:MAG: pyridoxal-dependent decarboxylase [Ilumatobacteraceae bacterium]
MREMHVWDDETDLFAHSVIGYAIERLRVPKDPRWGQHPASELKAALDGVINSTGVGGFEALRVFRDVLMPACRPMDDPMNLAYVPTAPTIAATMFDLVVSSASIFGGLWESGAGAIAAENQALSWLAEIAGYPTTAGGVFVSGGSAANLSALVAARHGYLQDHARPARFAVAATSEVHASVRAAARVMDIDVLTVAADDNGRMTGAALGRALDDEESRRGGTGASSSVFAVVATAGTTNAGAIDELGAIADVCTERGLWLHVDGAYGLAALASTTGRELMRGLERSDSFGVDPHKWLFAPYDCAALIYRDPTKAAAAHAQHGDYLDAVDRGEWNPSDYAYHLSRRARGLPLWFSLATYGTDAYSAAVDHTLVTAAGFADAVEAHASFDLLIRPELSIVLFRRRGWMPTDYHAWSRERARQGVALIVPSSWHDEICMRICLVNPRTQLTALTALLDDMATYPAAQPAS